MSIFGDITRGVNTFLGDVGDTLFGSTDVQSFTPEVTQVNPYAQSFYNQLSGLTAGQTGQPGTLPSINYQPAATGQPMQAAQVGPLGQLAPGQVNFSPTVQAAQAGPVGQVTGASLSPVPNVTAAQAGQTGAISPNQVNFTPTFSGAQLGTSPAFTQTGTGAGVPTGNQLASNVQPFMAALGQTNVDPLTQYAQANQLAQAAGAQAAGAQAVPGQAAADAASNQAQAEAMAMYQALGGAQSGAAQAAMARGALLPQLQFQQQQTALAADTADRVRSQILGQQQAADALNLQGQAAGGQLGLGLGQQQLGLGQLGLQETGQAGQLELGQQQLLSDVAAQQAQLMQQAGLAGQDISAQIASQNAQLAQQLGITEAELQQQLSLANAQLGQQAGLANQNVALQQSLLGGQLGQQAALANQDAALQQAALNAQLQQQANLAGQDIGFQQAQLNAQLGQQAGLANQDAALQQALLNAQMQQQAGFANQDMASQLAQLNAQLGLQGQIADVSAQQQAQQQQQNYLLSLLGLQAGMAGNEFVGATPIVTEQEGILGDLGQLIGGLGTAGLISSDKRLKDNLTETYKFKGITFYTWTWNETAKEVFNLSGNARGVVAQEVKHLVPDAVSVQKGYYVVDYDKIINYLREVS